MTNARAKGRRNELRAFKELESDGWIVEKAKMGSKFEKNKDFFHLFDLLAIKKIRRRTIIRWIQVKSNVCPKYVREAIKGFAETYFDKSNFAEVWVYKDRDGWQKYPMNHQLTEIIFRI